MQRGIRTVIGALALATATACAPPAPATPPPAATTAAPAPTTTAPGGITLPSRPRDIAIDDIEPCSLLTAEQRSRLGLDSEPRSSTGTTRLFGTARSCDVRGFEPRSISVGITLVTAHGIERLTGGGTTFDLTPVTAGGFPAVLARPSRSDAFCSVDIDIAEGRLIDVYFASGGRKPPVPQDQLCRDAQTVAAAVMTTLLAR